MTSPGRDLAPRIKTTPETTEAVRALWREAQAAAGRTIGQDALILALVILGRKHEAELFDLIKESA